MKSPCRVRLSYGLPFQALVTAPLCLLLLACGVLFAHGQAAQDTAAKQPQLDGPHTLAELLAQVPWDPQQQGAMLAVAPYNTRRDTKMPLPEPLSTATLGRALRAFHYALFPLGSLTVIAPTEMVLLHDKPDVKPNFYDGLPRELKVKYLLATLNDDQWKRLGNEGLGLGDLNAEQQKVFQSLLPDLFRYTRYALDDKGNYVLDERHQPKADGETISLSSDERLRVKLRVCRMLQVAFPNVNEPNSYALPPLSQLPGKPDGHRLVRDKSMDSTALYSVSFRSVVPNRLKPGQLNTAAHALDALVSLQGADTVQDLIARIAAATHIELYVQASEAKWPVAVAGDRVRAGDLLQALALALTGTYRKVENAYILTGDLEGRGTRVWKIANWVAEQQEKVERWKRR